MTEKKSHLSNNIRFLRKIKGLTQGELADHIGVKRSLIGSYEESRAEPKLKTLLAMSNFFEVSLESFVTEDMSKMWGKEISPSKDQVSRSFKVLAVTVDNNNEENIELVPVKAAAGYLNGYADPEFVRDLPKFAIPTLRGGTFRAFEIQGDSMHPMESGSIIIGKYIDDWANIKDGKTYVLVSQSEGLVYKRVYRKLDKGILVLKSDNPSYDPYEIVFEDVMEIWEAKMYISNKFPEETTYSLDQLTTLVSGLKNEIASLKGKF